MIKVICDTNIWYDLGEGIISFNQPDEYELCCTHLSLYELIHTPRLKEEPIKVSLASKAVLTYAKRIIYEPPLEYLTNLLLQKDNNSSNSNFLEAIEYLASGQLLDEDVINELDKHLASHKATIHKSFVSHLSDEMGAVRDFIHKDKSNVFKYKECIKQKDIRELRFEDLKSKIIKLVNYSYPIPDSTFTDKFWIKIEFFMKSWIAYSAKLKLDKTIKLKPNDAVDLMNLIYVNENFLYWTRDNSWKNIMREAKLGNYLFNNL